MVYSKQTWVDDDDASALSADRMNHMEDGIANATTISVAKIIAGSGSPEGVTTAPVGSLYLRTNGGTNTTLYIKESGTGNTGWVAK